MRKHRLYVIRRQGNQYRPVSIRFHRDAITGECSVSLSRFGYMFIACVEKVIPELINLANQHGRFPRQLPYEPV